MRAPCPLGYAVAGSAFLVNGVQFRWPYSTERELALSGSWSIYPAPTCTYRFSGIYAPHGLGGPATFEYLTY